MSRDMSFGLCDMHMRSLASRLNILWILTYSLRPNIILGF